MASQQAALGEAFLRRTDLSATELAALLGVSRQHVSKDLDAIVGSHSTLLDLCRTLRGIGTKRALDLCDSVTSFAKESLGLEVAMPGGGGAVGCKSFLQLLPKCQELWVCSSSPPELERSDYWSALCRHILDQRNKLLVYFVPTLELADRVAERFEDELFRREFDEDGRKIQEPEAFRATVFVIATSLVASTPHTWIINPGSADIADGPQSTWALGSDGNDFFELPIRFGQDFIRKARAAGLGVARNRDNFFPLGQSLKDSGIPFRSYPHVDQLIGIRLSHSVGLFEGEPIRRASGEERDPQQGPHPLKFFPAFIRAYRKKAGELSKQKLGRQTNERTFFEF
jgi:hypothetical protein